MLGYVRTDAPELRVREQQFYRALYCGLCHRMGKCTGNCSRMTLSYDFVFLAAVRLALTGERVTFKKQRCFLHPIRSRVTAQKCEALDFCADASALLSYHKLRDDLADERGLKRLRARLVRPFLSGGYRRAKKRRPDLDRLIAERLSAFSELERTLPEFGAADALGERFGAVMEAVFSDGLEGSDARIAAEIGRGLGHWIYLADAADDFLEDVKKNRFNPYRLSFGEAPNPEDWETVRLAMTARLCTIERAYHLIDGYPADELREILANVLYLGLPSTATAVTKKNEPTDGDPSKTIDKTNRRVRNT